MTHRPRNTPEAAQYSLPLVEPHQLDLLGFAAGRAMGIVRGRGREPEKLEGDEPSALRPLDPMFELFKDPWSSEHFIDGPAYLEAKQVLSCWRDWPRPAMALTGPRSSGKTHLAHIWAHDIGGRFETAQSLAALTTDAAACLASRALVVDMADSGLAHLQLFSIFNAAYAGAGPILLIGNAPPAAWPSSSTDLLSRFASLPSVRVQDPDDELLAAVLQSICRKRFVRLDDTVALGLINRSARSFETLNSLADGIERLVQVDSLEPSSRVLERILTYARTVDAGGADGFED